MLGKIYVVIPMYNAIDSIDSAVKSAISQNNVDIQVVLVDHGSKDETYKYVKDKYDHFSNISVIGLTRIPNEVRSASRPLNNGMKYVLEHADDLDWVMRLDSDDVLADENTLCGVLQNNTDECLLLSGSMVFIDTSKRYAQEYCQERRYCSVSELRKGAAYAYPHHSTLVSIKMLRKIWNKDNYCYYEKIGYGEDLDYTVRMLSLCKENQMIFTSKPMIIKELSGDTITNSVGFCTLMYDHFEIFRRNRCLSKWLFIKIVFWYVLENCGKIGRKINNMRTPPAVKYSVSNVLDFESVKHMKEKWNA